MVTAFPDHSLSCCTMSQNDRPQVRNSVGVVVVNLITLGPSCQGVGFLLQGSRVQHHRVAPGSGQPFHPSEVGKMSTRNFWEISRSALGQSNPIHKEEPQSFQVFFLQASHNR